MGTCETMLCEMELNQNSLHQPSHNSRRQEAAVCEVPTTLQPEDIGSMKASINAKKKNGAKRHGGGMGVSVEEKNGGKVGKDSGKPSPTKFVAYICAALACGFAIEFGTEKAYEQTTCTMLTHERTMLAEKLETVSDELQDRMVQMSSLLAKETSENSRLREELEHTKRALKYFQGNTKIPKDLLRTNDKSHLREHQHSWVEEAYADAAYKVWQVRYVFSEGLRNIRSYLPSELFLTKKLHYWEDALAGPTE